MGPGVFSGDGDGLTGSVVAVLTGVLVGVSVGVEVRVSVFLEVNVGVGMNVGVLLEMKGVAPQELIDARGTASTARRTMPSSTDFLALDRPAARQAICEGIEIFYRRQRRHSVVGDHRLGTFEQLP